jgi:hypothetical protein
MRRPIGAAEHGRPPTFFGRPCFCIHLPARCRRGRTCKVNGDGGWLFQDVAKRRSVGEQIAPSVSLERRCRKCGDSPGGYEADPLLKGIDLFGLDRGRSVDPGDLLYDADQLTPFFGREPLVEEIRE